MARIARLKKGEPIDALLYNGYSTISLGYAGLYECVKYMTGKSHTDPAATPFALQVMQKMNEATARPGRQAENIDYSLYGTPLESTTYRFAKCLQRRFGIVAGVNDRAYITNSYHVHVTEEIERLPEALLRGPVPDPLSRRRHQLCGSTQHAEQYGGRPPADAFHL